VPAGGQQWIDPYGTIGLAKLPLSSGDGSAAAPNDKA
jgi:hypothetical protein